MRNLMLCGLIALLPVAAQDDSWKNEIDNSLVRAARRLVAPHETVSIADSAPSLFVFLTEDPVHITIAGRREELAGKRGQCFWYPGGRVSLENPGEQRAEVARIVPKFSPDTSYQLPRANPQRVDFENDLMRMRHIGPRSAGAPKRAAGSLVHIAPSVVIDLSAGHFKLTHTDGRVDDIRRKGGEIWFQPASTFSDENLGDLREGLRHEALRIELKTNEGKP